MKRVLLVDDDPDTFSIYSVYLSRAGYELQSARNGVEALERLSSGRLPDIILLDLCMPKMDGYQLMEKLRSDPAFSQIPIVILSARVEPAAKRRAIALGALDFMEKPNSPDQVTARMREIDRGRFCTTGKELGEAMHGLTDETAIKRIKQSHARGFRPCPAWQDSNNRWCGYFNEVRQWFESERKFPR